MCQQKLEFSFNLIDFTNEYKYRLLINNNE